MANVQLLMLNFGYPKPGTTNYLRSVGFQWYLWKRRERNYLILLGQSNCWFNINAYKWENHQMFQTLSKRWYQKVEGRNYFCLVGLLLSKTKLI